jgi:hypothetical protein
LGLRGWRWEVAVTYVNVLADICLHGLKSEIQKQALVGRKRDLSATAEAQNQLYNDGLFDLVYFRISDETDDGGKDFHISYTITI